MLQSRLYGLNQHWNTHARTRSPVDILIRHSRLSRIGAKTPTAAAIMADESITHDLTNIASERDHCLRIVSDDALVLLSTCPHVPWCSFPWRHSRSQTLQKGTKPCVLIKAKKTNPPFSRHGSRNRRSNTIHAYYREPCERIIIYVYVHTYVEKIVRY